MQPIRTIVSRITTLLENDVDTDQIFPARFLRAPREECGRYLFADRAADRAPATDTQILLTGDNFGCGSSREHAVWALVQRGYRAVLARSFADAFWANAARNGLLLLTLDDADHRVCLGMAAGSEVTLDLEAQRLSVSEVTLAFTVDPFVRHCLREGIDELDYLLGFTEQIAAFESGRGETS